MIDVILHLRQLLYADIQRIHVPDNSSISRQALQRLTAVAEHSPAFLVLLVEPWLQTEALPERTIQLLEDAARVHLYARILDDALDENLPVYRRNLLRAQPLFWHAVQRIGANVSADVAAEAVQLIADTVSAVEIDDQRPNPEYWGAKNHHMLLAPLLLSDNNEAYQACCAELSTVIALVQAGDEWRQGELSCPDLRSDFINFLTRNLEPAPLAMLKQYGWHGVAERIIWDARQLLTALS